MLAVIRRDLLGRTEVGVFPGSPLPRHCVKCGAPEATQTRTLSHLISHSGWVLAGLLIWLGGGTFSLFAESAVGCLGSPAVFLISIAATMRKRTVTIPLCPTCSDRWHQLDRRVVWMGATIVGVPFVLWLISWALTIAQLATLALLWFAGALLSAILMTIRANAIVVGINGWARNRFWLTGVHRSTADAWAHEPLPPDWKPR